MESVDLDVAESSDGAEPPHLDVQPRAESGESQPAQGCILYNILPRNPHLSPRFLIFPNTGGTETALKDKILP